MSGPANPFSRLSHHITAARDMRHNRHRNRLPGGATRAGVATAFATCCGGGVSQPLEPEFRVERRARAVGRNRQFKRARRFGANDNAIARLKQTIIVSHLALR